MDFNLFFPKEFIIDDIVIEDTSVSLNLTSWKKSSICPNCGASSERIHSRYIRTLQDLTVFGKTVTIKLLSGKFFCNNSSCSRSIFTERFENLVKAYSRRTERLNEALVKFAFSLSSEAASRVSKYIFPKLSADTFIRIIRKEYIEIKSNYKYIGIDDWAFRKGISYGTLICDLETHRPIEILKDRTTKTLADWLKNRKDIEFITRDRANSYSKAVYHLLPSAIQIADKWHLLKNIGDTLNSILQSQYTNGITIENSQRYKEETISKIKSSQQELLRQARMIKNMELIEETKRLYASGVKQKDISVILGISKKTIYRYLRRSEPTYSSAKVRGSNLDEHIKKINELFLAGTSSKDIFLKILECGYVGCESYLGLTYRN